MILITGGLGFVCTKVARQFLEMGEEVVVAGHRNLDLPDFLAPYLGKGLQVTAIDITDLTTILQAIRKYRVKSIVHGVSFREGDGALYQTMAVNMTGTANLLEAARFTSVGRVTFLSSEAVYQGRKDKTPLKEEEFFWVRSDRWTPVIKKMGELLFYVYQNEYKLDVAIARLSRIYGPDYPPPRPITRMMVAALKGGQQDLSDLNGNEGHDFLYARDCARALAMIHLARKPRHGIYNIGSGKLTTFADVARTLEKIFPGSDLKLGSGQVATASTVGYVAKTEYDIETCLDISRITEEFGFVPEFNLEKGLSALVAWTRDKRYV